MYWILTRSLEKMKINNANKAKLAKLILVIKQLHLPQPPRVLTTAVFI
jgi:hypothetical protein